MALNPARMIADFGLPARPVVDRICGIVGASASRSLSPSLHNAAFRALAYPGLFLAFRVESFAEFWQEIVESRVLEQIGMSIQGLTVASPNKESAAALATIRSRTALRSESANLLFRRGANWVAATTDPTGVLANIDRQSIVGRRAAVVGCGGSGRAIAWALRRAGASVTLVNRCQERGVRASQLLGLPFTGLSKFSVEGFDFVINATPVGSQGDELPFSIDHLDRNAVVVDLVYTQRYNRAGRWGSGPWGESCRGSRGSRSPGRATVCLDDGAGVAGWPDGRHARSNVGTLRALNRKGRPV